MEKLKWLYRKWGFPFILLCLAIAAGSLLADIRNETDRKKSEEVRESIADISGSGIVTNNTGAADGEEVPQEPLSSQYFLEESDSLLSEEEERELESSALSAAMQVQGVYKDTAIEEELPYTYTVSDFSREQRKRVVSILGAAGYVSVTDGANMENHESVKDFYSAYLKEQDTMVTIFDVNLDGMIGAYTFLHRGGKLQTFYVKVGWRKGGIPEVISTAVSDIAEIKLTEKDILFMLIKYSFIIPACASSGG